MNGTVKEFLKEIEKLQEKYKYKLTVEASDLTLRVVSAYEDHRVIAYLDNEWVDCDFNPVIDVEEQLRVINLNPRVTDGVKKV